MIAILSFILLFYALILGLGLFVSRHEQNDCQQMILANRSLPLWVGIITMTATWVGGGYINGTAEAVASSGMIWAQAPWGYAIALFLGGLFFAKKMRQANYTTMLCPFAEKYGNKIAAVLFIPALIGEICWSAAILTALGATCSILFDIDLNTAIIASSFVAIAYTYSGGMKSVAYTDVLQLALIVIGLFITLPFLFERYHGLANLWQAYTQQMGSKANIIPTDSKSFSWLWVDNALLLMLGGIPWGVYFQRVLASSSPKQAQSLSFYAAFGCLFLAIPPILIGMVAATYDWSAIGLSSPLPANSLIAVIKYLTPTWVAMVALGAVSAAVMSSVDSSILSSSSMFSWNVYQPLIYPYFPRLSPQRMIKVSIAILGSIATWIALSVGSIYTLWILCSDLVYVILFPQLLAIFYFKNTSKQAVIIALILGLTIRLAGGEPNLNIKPLIHALDASYFPVKTTAMLLSLCTLYFLPKFQMILQSISIKSRHQHSLLTDQS